MARRKFPLEFDIRMATLSILDTELKTFFVEGSRLLEAIPKILDLTDHITEYLAKKKEAANGGARSVSGPYGHEVTDRCS